MKKLFARFVEDESGATAIEYGLIAGLIAVVIIGTVATLGDDIDDVFSTISSALAAEGL
ncbi:MAG: Flp family type IVb pilin [Roseibium sp.]|nr:Flp family type IVb pilin [Roseibium sp.]